MGEIPQIPPGEYVPTADGRVVMHGVSWASYEAILEAREERAVPRISYVDGEMELLTPSRGHERVKSYLGRLVEAYAMERDVDLSPYGSWTVRRRAKQAGIEADECYLIGSQDKDQPDLAIEVIWTSGGIDKLEAYRRLGVGEVWLWQDGAIAVFVLGPGGYEPSPQSAVFPELDLSLLCSFLDAPTAMQAVKAFRAALATG